MIGHPNPRPLLVSLAAALLLSLAAATLLRLLPWGRSLSSADLNSPLELLLQVSGQNASEPQRIAPPPPRPAYWISPLQGLCPALDRSLQRRLLQLQAKILQRTTLRRIDPSNYGQRYRLDGFGNPVDPTPKVIVLHETVYGLSSALNTFATAHANDADQVSYHSLVGLDGELVRVVDPDDRAFGAGFSAFNNQWVISNPKLGGSVNNFALHLSLETPLDGENEGAAHSGYTDVQYDTMALELSHWMRRYRISPEHITTHQHVDLGGERADPRSFDWSQLAVRLKALGVICTQRR
jgi:N-acetylmuramoyl-L-alanine amidase